MGRSRGRLRGGHGWLPAIPLAVTVACAIGMAATGCLMCRDRGPSLVVISEPAARSIHAVQGGDSPLPGGVPAGPASAAPPAPGEPQSSAPCDNTTSVAGAGTVRASFTVVAPPGS